MFIHLSAALLFERYLQIPSCSCVSFLQHHQQLKHLVLEEIHFGQEEFRPVFEILATDMGSLEHVHSNNLWEQRLVYFDAPGKPDFLRERGLRMSNVITKSGSDARKLI